MKDYRLPHFFARTAPAAASVLLLLALLPALPVLAAEAEKPPGPMDLLYQGINLAVLLAIIIYFARKPVARFFRGTAQGEKETYDKTRSASEQAQAELEAQKKRIDGLEAELGRMAQAARDDAETERKNLLVEAEATAERIKAQSRQQVEQEMNKARSELRAQLADEAVKLAEELVKARMDDKRQKQLVKEYTQQIEAAS